MSLSARARRTIWVVAASLVLVPATLAIRTFVSEYVGFREPPTPLGQAARERASARLPGLVDVSWRSGGATLRGWFVPGRERAAIVFVHGSGGNRTDVLPELEILSQQGFALLAFDWPGQGESGGEVEWGDAEREAVRSALDYLAGRPEVDADRIGAFGFSLGGVPLTQVAVGDPRVRALAIVSTPGDLLLHARWENRRFGAITLWPMLLADRLRGMRMTEQVPDQIIGRLAPRPLFVVLGESDVIVPAALSRAIFDAAGEPKELLSLPNTGHGEQARSAGPAYAQHLAAFFARALLP